MCRTSRGARRPRTTRTSCTPPWWSSAPPRTQRSSTRPCRTGARGGRVVGARWGREGWRCTRGGQAQHALTRALAAVGVRRYAGDKDGRGGIYNFVTKRGLCAGDRAKISWTQVSAFTGGGRARRSPQHRRAPLSLSPPPSPAPPTGGDGQRHHVEVPVGGAGGRRQRGRVLQRGAHQQPPAGARCGGGATGAEGGGVPQGHCTVCRQAAPGLCPTRARARALRTVRGAGGHWHQDDPRGQQHAQPHHQQGHQRRPVAQRLPGAGAGAAGRTQRAQLQPVRLDAHWRPRRRQHLPLHPGAQGRLSRIPRCVRRRSYFRGRARRHCTARAPHLHAPLAAA